MLRDKSREKNSYSNLLKTNENEQWFILHQFKQAMNCQQRKFKVMNVHCDFLQQIVENLQKKVEQYEKNLQHYIQENQNKQINSVQMIRNNVIIEQLNKKTTIISRNELKLHDEIKKAKSDNAILQAQVSSDEQKLKLLENNFLAKIKNKDIVISQLNKKIQQLNNQIVSNNTKALLEKNTVNTAQSENLVKQISKLEHKLIESQEEKKILLTKLTSSIQKLQMQLKAWQEKCKKLQQGNKLLIAKASQNQISLYQQIMHLKVCSQEEQKKYKDLQQEYHIGIAQLSRRLKNDANKFKPNNMKQQFHEIVQQITKTLQQLGRAKQLQQLQIKCLIEEIQLKNSQIIKLEDEIKKQRSITLFTILTKNDGQSKNPAGLSANDQNKDKINIIEKQLNMQYQQSNEKLSKLQQQFLLKNRQCLKKQQLLTLAKDKIKQLQLQLQINNKSKEKLTEQYIQREKQIFQKIKYFLNSFRHEIGKLITGQAVALESISMIPVQLEEEYYFFMSHLKAKISQTHQQKQNERNLYQKQIQQYKKEVDNQKMNCYSMKNLMKNIVQIWISQDYMQDDLRDNMQLYSQVAKLSDLEKSRLIYFIVKYRQMKKVQ